MLTNRLARGVAKSIYTKGGLRGICYGWNRGKEARLRMGRASLFNVVMGWLIRIEVVVMIGAGAWGHVRQVPCPVKHLVLAVASVA